MASKPNIELIQNRFPIGDRIEYQTSNGYFEGTIIGYEESNHGISLNLGDRRFPIWDDIGIKRAESYHKPALTDEEKLGQLSRGVVANYAQLTLF